VPSGIKQLDTRLRGHDGLYCGSFRLGGSSAGPVAAINCGNECVGHTHKRRYKFMSRLQRAGKHGRVFDYSCTIWLRSLRIASQSSTDGIKSKRSAQSSIVDNSTDRLTQSHEVRGQKLVSQRILQPTKAANERLDSLRLIGLIVEAFRTLCCKRLDKQSVIGCGQARAFPMHHPHQKLQSFLLYFAWCHSR